jgi:NOL1/NOP2/fmu family ribosome biogenesis protein
MADGITKTTFKMEHVVALLLSKEMKRNSFEITKAALVVDDR